MTVVEAALPPIGEAVAARQILIQAVEAQMHKLIWVGRSSPDGGEQTAQHASSYHLTSGGHRIRAQLAVHASLALCLPVGDAVAIAAAAELIHNASLIHDDLQDRDLMRHGVAAVWSLYGDGIAICAGDLLLSAAYCALSALTRPHLLPILIPMVHSRIVDASIGQCVDLTSQKNRVCSFEDYARLASLKSGSLLALPIELALAAAGELQAIPLARRAAESFSVGYQVFDDLKDVKKDLMRATAQPAINVVSVLQACNPAADA
ncbi:MAG: polyprenyl synthetase family protein, partial [Polaromonas sp.]|nr:polyprenyl synthetase family protein [Polaromonas sp.]